MEDAAALYDPSRGVTYGTSGLETQGALKEALCDLMRAPFTSLVPSGLAAVTVPLLALLSPGDEVVLTDCIYGPTRRFLDRTLKRYGVVTRFHDPMATPQEIEALFTDKTKILILESPGSLTFEMVDIPDLARRARARGITTLCDHTWDAGVFFNPLDHGLDIAVQAISKYVGGHSDLLMGSMATRDEGLYQKIEMTIQDQGWFTSADEAYLALRGLRTLIHRIEACDASARQVAAWLETQPSVSKVLHPALPSHPQHDLWKRDFNGAAGLIGFVLKGADMKRAERFLDQLTLFGIGYSWGGYESLAIHCDPQLAYRQNPVQFDGALIRLNIGLEHPEDLIADLAQALTLD